MTATATRCAVDRSLVPEGAREVRLFFATSVAPR
jgi:hypothetical protein